MSIETLAADPWECAEPAGAKLLDDVVAFLARFVAYPTEHCRTAHALWCAHTHLMDAAESTPRLAFLSPEPGSGKTRALEVTELLVPRPVEAVNVTPAYLFRKVAAEEGRPTILFDEIDTVFGPKARDNEELRGLLNAGHRKGAVAGRCVVRGKVVETEEIPASARRHLPAWVTFPTRFLLEASLSECAGARLPSGSSPSAGASTAREARIYAFALPTGPLRLSQY